MFTLEKKKFEISLNLKLIIIAVVLLLVSAGTVFFLFKTFVPPQNQASAEDNPLKAELGPMYETEEFVVNLSGTTGRRFLRTKMSFELSNDKVLEEIQAKLPLINDSVLMILSGATIDELSSEGGKEAIKNRLKEKLNTFLAKGEVLNIYYNTIVWQ